MKTWLNARILPITFRTFAYLCVLSTINFILIANANAQKNQPHVWRSTQAPKHLHFNDEQLLQTYHKWTFGELNNDRDIALQGSYGNRRIVLGGRRDRVVTQAKMTINYHFSPALLTRLSHVKMYLNDELIGFLPVEQNDTGKLVTKTIDINPHIFANLNAFNFELIGHYTDRCEDPQHSSIWLTINKNSTLEITTLPLTLKNELSFFPQPFFDQHDFDRQPLPFILPEGSPKTLLRAAGITASWFGVQSAWRGVENPVLINHLPNKHAVVFATNEHRPYFLENYPEIKLPTIEVVSHPEFDHIKLLLILGPTKDDLVTAAQGLALGTAGFSGNATYVKQVEHITPREAYDAPNWVRTNRPVKLVELVQSPQDLEVSGYLPPSIVVNMNVPADLFTWRSSGIPLDLKYRHSLPVKLDESRLNVSINQQFIQAFNLQSGNQADLKERVRVPLLSEESISTSEQLLIPAFKVGSANQLNFDFSFASYRQDQCATGQLYNIRASMDGNSEIDFTDFPHYAQMPNLAFFANSGYPFTKFADLSQTAVIINENAPAHEIEALLTVLGTLSASSGYPAIQFTLAYPNDTDQFADKDIIVLNALEGELLQAAKSNGLPALLSAQNREISSPVLSSKLHDDKSDYQSLQDPRVASALNIDGTGHLSALVGFESPYTAKRSVVTLMATSKKHLEKAVTSLTEPGKISQMFGNVVIFRGEQISSDLVGETYFVGALPAWTLIWYHLSERPFLLIFLTLIAMTIISFTLWRALVAASTKRLRDSGDDI